MMDLVEWLVVVLDSIMLNANYRAVVGAAAAVLSLLALYAIVKSLLFILPAGVEFAWSHIQAKMEETEDRYWGRLRRYGFTKRTLWILAWTLLFLAAVVMVSDVVLDKSATRAVVIQIIGVPIVVLTGCLAALLSLDSDRREAFDWSRFFIAFLKPVIVTFLILNAHNLLKFGGKYALSSVL